MTSLSSMKILLRSSAMLNT